MHKIIMEAKKLLPKAKSRNELMERISKKFNCKINYVNFIFDKYKFRTGIKRGFKKGDKRIKGFKIPENRYNYQKNLKNYKWYKIWLFIKAKPRFSFELLDKNYYSYAYKKLRILGYPIQRTVISGRCKGSIKTNFGRKLTIYYSLDKRKEAMERLKEFNPKITTCLKASIGRAILNGDYNKIRHGKKSTKLLHI